MRYPITALAAPIAALSLSACSAEPPRTVTVTATGTAEAEATHFHLEARLIARGETREEAARAGEALSVSIREALPRLEGLEDLRLKTERLQFSTLCDDENPEGYGRSGDQCEPIGYAISQQLVVAGAPADQAANAASLVSQLGALHVVIRGYSVESPSALRAAAIGLATEDARTRADVIAASVGARIGGIVSVTPRERYDDFPVPNMPSDVNSITVTATRVSPEVAMSVEPGPITTREDLTFVFELMDAQSAEADE